MNLQAIKQRFGIIGSSKLLDQALDTAIRVANTDLSVLITGESGVGKEVFSRIIHSLSHRKHNKFIAINTGAIPEGTINSELFGHEKGAFTGATSDRKGYFETVDGGTIFLDEIGEMPLDTQAFLLRVLESGEFMKVGASRVMKTDVRVIAATNKSLEEKIRQGRFRDDLYYRLNTVPIKVPALRERPEDINILFRKFVLDFAEKYRRKPIQLDEKARMLLVNYLWPGNIRELKNIAEQISVLTEGQLITAEQLINFLPNINQRNLPMITDIRAQNGANFEEREILYKLLFEMKSDLTDLKSFVYELIKNNNLSVSNVQSLKQLQVPTSHFSPTSNPNNLADFLDPNNENTSNFSHRNSDTKPIILDPNSEQLFHSVELVEESLKLEDMEKELIKKALTKHKGRRKDAAKDLGISERTLYRKIKEYEL